MFKKSERGQAIILIVFSIIGIIGLTALTVDGGMAFSDRRQAQGAADSAAWAAGLANARQTAGDTDGDGIPNPDINNIIAAAYDIAERNGFPNDDEDDDADPSNATRSDVFISVVELPIAPDPLPNGDPNPCPEGASPNVEITVQITSYVNTFFAPVIGVQQLTNQVEAVTRACGTYIGPNFGGQAIFSLSEGVDTDNCAFNSGQGAAEWDIKCSGIMSNTCAFGKNLGSVEFFDENGNPDPDLCVSATTGVSGALASKACSGAPSEEYNVEYVESIMPPNPCTLPVTNGVYTGGGLAFPSLSNQTTFVELSPDAQDRSVYCVDNADDLENVDVKLNYATLYFMEEDFDLKYAGNTGSVYGTPTQSGTYASYSIIVPLPTNPQNYCTASNDNSGPNMDYRGNANGILYGTFFAPSACIDMRGNAGSTNGQADALTINGQVVGNFVTSNGTANVTVNYCLDQDRREPKPPIIDLVK